MGIRIALDLDTDLGNSREVYVKIETLNINRVTNTLGIGVTLWLLKKYSDKARKGDSILPFGQICSTVILYREGSDDPLGEQIELPTYIECELPCLDYNLMEYAYTQVKSFLESNLSVSPEKIKNID